MNDHDSGQASMPDPGRIPWWKSGVIYQIYPRSYRDTTGSGVGDLNGILHKLDYLEELGIDAVWISPCFPSPMADFGYDVSDYVDIHPMFGSLEDLDRLVSAAHDRDIRILLDFVPNHSSDQHAWFIESKAARDNPKRDWYVWKDPKPDGSPPNNWLSVFGGPAWTWDEATGQYYLHKFLKEQPDLNWRNPEVQAAMFDVLRFWLDRGVDGFRIDVAHYIMKDPQFRDNPTKPAAPADFFKPMGEYVTGERFLAGEIHIFDLDEWASYFGDEGSELHFPINFSLFKAGWSAEEMRSIVDESEAVLGDSKWPNYVLGNHDEPRIATRYGKAQARVAAMLLLTLRGTPTIYYGDEIGMEDGHIPDDQIQDPWPLRSGLLEISRDPCRTPMQWTEAGGFSNSRSNGAMPEPWLPVHQNCSSTNVDSQEQDPASMLALYRRLLELRGATPALRIGDYHSLDGPPDTYVYIREAAGERRLIALNFSSTPRTIHLPTKISGRVLLSTHMDREGEMVHGKTLELRPDEGCLVA
jgi:alpha-glucosidase